MRSGVGLPEGLGVAHVLFASPRRSEASPRSILKLQPHLGDLAGSRCAGDNLANAAMQDGKIWPIVFAGPGATTSRNVPSASSAPHRKLLRATRSTSSLRTRFACERLVRPVVRYEPTAPSEMLHIDTKKLGCIRARATA